ncbi:hypothetical protein PVAP13_2NG301106 [Panicum virgatum]|uniref:Uncharacterized protein n=1 Tax=Panicum virgatum TaxID=38727 RepID=A0A8T0V9Y5_PANVG|nr:hypothetical protein PVAP13_2NG301106 [Panicum virgatum]
MARWLAHGTGGCTRRGGEVLCGAILPPCMTRQPASRGRGAAMPSFLPARRGGPHGPAAMPGAKLSCDGGMAVRSRDNGAARGASRWERSGAVMGAERSGDSGA